VANHQDNQALLPVKHALELLATCNEVDDEIFRQVLDDARLATGSHTVCIAERIGPQPIPPAEEGTQPEGTGSYVRYIAASTAPPSGSHGSNHVLERHLLPGQGVTWRVWANSPAPPLTDADESAPTESQNRSRSVETEPKLVLVQSVLRPVNGEVHFFNLPTPGAFAAVAVTYGSLAHADAFPSAPQPQPQEEAEEEEEDAAAGAPSNRRGSPLGRTQERALALCMDTAGIGPSADHHPYTPQEVSNVCVTILCM
jgi:hypothetical protein